MNQGWRAGAGGEHPEAARCEKAFGSDEFESMLSGRRKGGPQNRRVAGRSRVTPLVYVAFFLVSACLGLRDGLGNFRAMVQPTVSTENFSFTCEKSPEAPAFLAVRELDLIDLGDPFVQTRIALLVLVHEPKELFDSRGARYSLPGKETNGFLRQRRIVRYLGSFEALARMVQVTIRAELLAATPVQVPDLASALVASRGKSGASDCEGEAASTSSRRGR